MAQEDRQTKRAGRQRKGAQKNRLIRQRGSAALEAALVILPTLALCFSLLDFPLQIFIQNSIQSAVREGVRFAITQQTGGSGQDAAIKNIVKTNSMGFINDTAISNNTASITIQYYDPGLTAVSGTGSNAGGNIIVVTGGVKRSWMVPIYLSSALLSFQASSADVMEAPPGGVIPSR
jgi:Flp pilus assembly protein TadG